MKNAAWKSFLIAFPSDARFPAISPRSFGSGRFGSRTQPSAPKQPGFFRKAGLLITRDGPKWRNPRTAAKPLPPTHRAPFINFAICILHFAICNRSAISVSTEADNHRNRKRAHDRSIGKKSASRCSRKNRYAFTRECSGGGIDFAQFRCETAFHAVGSRP